MGEGTSHRESTAATTPLTPDEVDRLALFNTQNHQGILHTDEKRAEMAELQRRFDTAGWLPRRRRKLRPDFGR